MKFITLKPYKPIKYMSEYRSIHSALKSQWLKARESATKFTPDYYRVIRIGRLCKRGRMDKAQEVLNEYQDQASKPLIQAYYDDFVRTLNTPVNPDPPADIPAEIPADPPADEVIDTTPDIPLDGRLAELEAELQTLRADLQTAKTQQKELESELEQRGQALQDANILNTELSEYKTRYEEQESHITSLQETNQRLQEQIDTPENTGNESYLQEEIDQLQQDIADVQDDYTEALEEVSKWQAALGTDHPPSWDYVPDLSAIQKGDIDRSHIKDLLDTVTSISIYIDELEQRVYTYQNEPGDPDSTAIAAEILSRFVRPAKDMIRFASNHINDLNNA